MKTFLLGLWAIGFGLVLALAAPAPVADARDENVGAELALFQSNNIYNDGLARSHTIALTFDDGPNAHTEEVLDVLKKLHVKATFFIVGNMAHRYPGTLQRIAAEGHLLANHSATHVLLSSRYDNNPELLLHQLRDVDEQIEPLMKPGDKLYFRAPYGAWKPAHAEILNKDPVLRNYIGPIFWDAGGQTTMSRDGYVMSSADWDCWNHKWSAKTCAKGYLREIRRKDGGVVLMHCIHVQSAALVAAVVAALIEECYNFVRLDQMPAYRQYETPGDDGIASAAPSGKMQMVRASDVK